MKRSIRSDLAPAPIGPYSQAIESGGIIYVSGQIPIDPKINELVKGGIREQTERVMENLKAVLAQSGASMEDVVMTFVYLIDLNDFQGYNEVYEKYFKEPPAR